jgi:hypothetical protein
MSVNDRTESDLSDWLNSAACTLEAVGWSDFGSDGLHVPTGGNALREFNLYNGPGRWPPPEVLQMEIASAS